MSSLKTIPGPKPRFLIGNLGYVDSSKLHMSMYNMRQEYGKLFQFWMFSQRVIIISDAALMEQAFCQRELCHRPDDFMKHLKYDGSGYLDSNFSEPELALKAAVWRALASLKSDEVMKKLREAELESFLNSLNDSSGIPCVEFVLNYTAKQFATELTGIEATDIHKDAVKQFIDAVKEINGGGKQVLMTQFRWMRYIPGPLRRSANRIIATRDKLAETLVTDAKTNRVESQEHGILQTMMAAAKPNGNTITDKHLIACTMDILFNSVTPVASFISFSILQAVKYPTLQEKIHAELDRASMHGGQDTTNVKVEEIPRESIPFLEAFILESMRMLSVVNLTKPHLASEDTVVDDYMFPKGSLILGDIFGIHHDEDQWDEPWSFNPERFLDKDGNALPGSDPARKRVQHFGLGMRQCRGIDVSMEHIFSCVLQIFAKYRVVPKPGSELPSNDPRGYITEVVPIIPEFTCIFEMK